VDPAGNAYVAGFTGSPDFRTTPGAFDRTFTGGPFDAFATKLDPVGSVVYSTYLGGSGVDVATSIAVDSAGNAYVTGSTTSTNFPTTAAAFDRFLSGGSDAFVTKLDPAGSVLIFSTYLGGGGSDNGNGIAVDAAGNAYVTGSSDSADFPPTAGAFDPTFNGGLHDAFVAKISFAPTADLALRLTDTPDPVVVGSPLTYGLTIFNNGPSAATQVVVTDLLPTGVTFLGAGASQGACSNFSGKVICQLGTLANGASAIAKIQVRPTVLETLNNRATVTATEFDPNLTDNRATASTTVIGKADLSLGLTDTPHLMLVVGTLTYTLTIVNNGPNAATQVVVTDRLPTGGDVPECRGQPGRLQQPQRHRDLPAGNIGQWRARRRHDPGPTVRRRGPEHQRDCQGHGVRP